MNTPFALRYSRVLQLAAAAIAGGLISAGGYAIAASGGSAVHACADARTGILHLQKRCHRGQRGITWNQRGPQGIRGTTGPAGTSSVTAWGVVAGDGSAVGAHGISAQHVSAGTYRVTATPAQCAQGMTAPVVSVSDSNPPAGQTTGAFSVAWVGDAGGGTFMVTTGVAAGGTFTATDRTFNVEVACT